MLDDDYDFPDDSAIYSDSEVKQPEENKLQKPAAAAEQNLPKKVAASIESDIQESGFEDFSYGDSLQKDNKPSIEAANSKLPDVGVKAALKPNLQPKKHSLGQQSISLVKDDTKALGAGEDDDDNFELDVDDQEVDQGYGEEVELPKDKPAAVLLMQQEMDRRQTSADKNQDTTELYSAKIKTDQAKQEGHGKFKIEDDDEYSVDDQQDDGDLEFEEEEVPEETISDQQVRPLVQPPAEKKEESTRALNSLLPSLPMTSKKQSFSLNEPTKQSNKDEKGMTERKMDGDQTSNLDLNSRLGLGAPEASSIVDEVLDEDLNMQDKQNTDSTTFFSPPVVGRRFQNNAQAGLTSHSAMNNGIMKPSGQAKVGLLPKGIGIKSQLNSTESLSNNNGLEAQTVNSGLVNIPAPPAGMGEKKFSLVPFAKAKSSSQYSSASEATSLTQIPVINRTGGKNPMELIHETPDEKDASGKELQAKLGANAPIIQNKQAPQVKEVDKEDDEDDDDDDYEDDNDFEPFETSKKDFYQGESQDSLQHKNESEAKSQLTTQQQVAGRQTPQSSINARMEQQMVTPGMQRQQQLQGVAIVNQQALQVHASKLKPPTKMSPKALLQKSPKSDKHQGLPDDQWIQVPPLEQKFRFVLPSNCHISKTIQAALSHAARIVSTAQKRDADGEVSIEFGLNMNDGPMDDSLSARPKQMPNSPSQVRLAHRHADCKTSDHELDHFTWKALNLPEDWQPHAQLIYHVIMLREGQRIMFDAMQIIAAEKLKKEANYFNMSQRQSVMALVQSKRHVGLNTGRRSIMSHNQSVMSGASHLKESGVGVFKSKQEAKLAQLEQKYVKVLQRQEQLQNPFYFQELRAALKQDQQDLKDAKKFHKQLQLDNQQIEMQMMRMQKNIEKNHDAGSSTDVGSKEMSSMMTNLDATNQQLFNLKERLEKARAQATTHEEKLSDFQTKHEKLIMVAQNYHVDPARAKEYINVVKSTQKGNNNAPERVQIQAEQKLSQVQEKSAQAVFKRDKAKSEYEELLAKKKTLLDEMLKKKEKLFSLIQDSKETQNKAIKMTRAIRADKDAYLKLGSLQTATNKSQASLKGWQPENAKQITLQKANNLYSSVEQSSLVASQKPRDSDYMTSPQQNLSIDTSAKEFQYLSGGGSRMSNKKPSVLEPPNLTPLAEAINNRYKNKSSMLSQNPNKAKPMAVTSKKEDADTEIQDELDDDEDQYSMPADESISKSRVDESVQKKLDDAVPTSQKKDDASVLPPPKQTTEAKKEDQKGGDDDDEDGYSDESFTENTIDSPKARDDKDPLTIAPQASKSVLPNTLQVAPPTADSQSSRSMITGITSLAPAMNPAFQPKNLAAPATLGSKPAILGSKPNFLAKKRKF